MAVTALSTYAGTGAAPLRGEERHNGRYPWSDIYCCAGGGYVTISAIESHFYRNLCHAMGHPEWETLQYADDAVQDEIRAELQRIFLGRSRDEWFELLKDKELCISPVLSVAEAARSEQVKARGSLQPHVHPQAGEIPLLMSPIRMRHAPAQIRRPAPALGEHTGEILAGVGVDGARLAELVAAGEVGRAHV